MLISPLKVPRVHHPGPEAAGSPGLLQDDEGGQDRDEGQPQGQVHPLGTPAQRQGQGEQVSAVTVQA